MITLDFRGEGKPDIDVKFKTHPIIRKCDMRTFSQSKLAFKKIKKDISSTFHVNPNIIGLFEIGYRILHDERLEFSKFLQNMSTIEVSHRYLIGDG